MKRPAFQFYPGDWLQDAGLRMCSAGARGLWIDMICLMHQGTPYGYLKVNHTPILAVNLARISGATLPDVEGWIGELEMSGVFSRDDSGAIYSRRMIRDENIRAARAAGGILGGNPALTGKKTTDPMVNLSANLGPTPSSSSSSSSSSESKEQDQERREPSAALSPTEESKPSKVRQPPSEAFTPPGWIDSTAWSEYLAMRKKKRAPPTTRACELVIAELAKLKASGQDPNAVLDQSTRNSWTDVYALKSHGANHATSTPSRNLSAVERVKAANDRAEQRQRDEIDAEYRIVG